MRLRLTFAPADGVCRLPLHYNQLVQGFLYRHLDESLAQALHDEGFVEGKRRLRLFTFSRLQGRSVVDGGTIVFADEFSLVVASPDVRFLESLAMNVMRNRRVSFGEAVAELTAVEVEADTPYQRPALLRALSPITVYSTLMHPDGRRKTYYYSPWEEEFSSLIVRNLERKCRVFMDTEVTAEDGYVKPVRVSARNQHVAFYKGTVIRAWSGIY